MVMPTPTTVPIMCCLRVTMLVVHGCCRWCVGSPLLHLSGDRAYARQDVDPVILLINSMGLQPADHLYARLDTTGSSAVLAFVICCQTDDNVGALGIDGMHPHCIPHR
jgi:hypothetical protein